MNPNWASFALPSDAASAAWQAAVGATLGIETRISGRRAIAGSVASRKLGDFKLARFWSSGHVLTRGRSAAEPSSHLLVSLQIGGEAHLVQDSRHVAVGAGSGAVGLLDTGRPFELSFPGEVERIFFFVPEHALRARAPWLLRPEPASLGPENPVTGILREYMLRIGDPECRVDDRRALTLLDGFVGALAAASALARADRDGDAADRRALRRDLICAYVRHRLGDTALSPASVAHAFAMSTRSLHKLFEGTGSSFSEWLLAQRLEACATALMSLDEPRRISDMAYAAGFNDLSHFNRSFRSRFKTTPREWRRCGHRL